METVIIEAEVPETVADVLKRLAADDKALLRRIVSTAVVEFANANAAIAAIAAAPAADSWDSFLKQSRDLALDGLPGDFSVNHDHYLHGAFKRDPAP